MSFKVTIPTLVAVMLVAAMLARSEAQAAGDPAKGKEQFSSKCSICHSTEADEDRAGPSLAGIVGRKSASAPKFAYSPAMKNYNQVWDEKTLDTYLTNPRQAVPGTKMVFLGVKNQSDRDDLIAYLATLK